MSTVPIPPPRSRRKQSPRFTGLPTWSGIAVVFAALVTGLLLSVNAQQVSWPFLLCFGLAAIVVALLTEARGLYLTVATLPALFGLMTVVTSWAVGRSIAGEGSEAFSITSIATAVYPLAEFFPVLFFVTAGAALIAVIRLWLLKRSGQALDAAAIERRRRTAEADRRNRADVSRVRNKTQQITVDELIQRNRSRHPQRETRRRNPDDDLYS